MDATRRSCASRYSGTSRVSIRCSTRIRPTASSIGLMFEPLLTADAKGNPRADARGGGTDDRRTAASAATASRSRIICAKTRSGPTASPVTSEDVKWSWQAIMNPSNNIVSRHGYDYVKSIDTPDARDGRRASQAEVLARSSTRSSPRAISRIPSRRSTSCRSIQTSTLSVQRRTQRQRRTVPIRRMVARRPHRRSSGTTDSSWVSRTWTRIEIKVVPDENTSVNLLRTHAIDYMFQASPQTYPAV